MIFLFALLITTIVYALGASTTNVPMSRQIINAPPYHPAEIIPGPGLPSLASLGLTTADLTNTTKFPCKLQDLVSSFP